MAVLNATKLMIYIQLLSRLHSYKHFFKHQLHGKAQANVENGTRGWYCAPA